MVRTADLLAFEDRAGLLARNRRLVQSLVAVRVKLLAGRVKGDDTVSGQHLFDSALRQLDTLVQADKVRIRLLGRISDCRKTLGGNRAERHVEDVDFGDEVLGEGLERKVLCLLLLADRDFLQVLKVGQCPQASVLSGRRQRRSKAGGGNGEQVNIAMSARRLVASERKIKSFVKARTLSSATIFFCSSRSFVISSTTLASDPDGAVAASPPVGAA